MKTPQRLGKVILLLFLAVAGWSSSATAQSVMPYDLNGEWTTDEGERVLPLSCHLSSRLGSCYAHIRL